MLPPPTCVALIMSGVGGKAADTPARTAQLRAEVAAAKVELAGKVAELAALKAELAGKEAALAATEAEVQQLPTATISTARHASSAMVQTCGKLRRQRSKGKKTIKDLTEFHLIPVPSAAEAEAAAVAEKEATVQQKARRTRKMPMRASQHTMR